jgi:hypothetical protein
LLLKKLLVNGKLVNHFLLSLFGLSLVLYSHFAHLGGVIDETHCLNLWTLPRTYSCAKSCCHTDTDTVTVTVTDSHSQSQRNAHAKSDGESITF